MSELLDGYLAASEMHRWTLSTYLKRSGSDYRTHHPALMSEIEQAIAAGRVAQVPSKNGGIAYLEVIE